MKKIITIFAIFMMLALIFMFKKIEGLPGFIIANGAEKLINEGKEIIKEAPKSIEKPKDILKFIDVPKKKTGLGDETIYNDVTSRQNKPFGDKAGRSTNVHETVHGIHSELRNLHYRMGMKKCNMFYCLKGRAVAIENPNITLTTIKKYIPPSLRSYRHELYFNAQLKDWNDVPTYVMDEWIAYISGGECAVQDFKNGLPKEDSDAVSGCLDFSIYTVSFAIAVQKEDPDYWSSHPEFMEFIRFNMERAERTFLDGREDFPSKKQEVLLNSLLNNEDAKEIRDFLRNELDGRFLN